MNLELRPFGRTGLLVSPFFLGTMEFGAKVDQSEAARLFDRAVEIGVNVIDTANVYAGGRSEEIVGQFIREKRDRLILATKFSVRTDSQDPNSGGTSRRTVIAACEASLRRLRTDYIDVYSSIDHKPRRLSTRRYAHSTTSYVPERSAISAPPEPPAGSWSTCCGAPMILALIGQSWNKPLITCLIAAPSAT